MAKVEIKEYREQYAHFGFYKQGAGGDVQLLIRRKVGEPTDYMHPHSKAVQRQREILSQASIHYSHLTPTQKADWRRQIRWVSRIPPGSKSEEVILKGRQLFISEDMHELATKQKQIILPREICIILTDQELNPLVGSLWLFLFADGEWWELPSEQLSATDWLFPIVPRGAEFYRVIGAAEGYIDPLLAEHQYMSEDFLRTYHYHKLVLGEPNILTFYCDADPEVSSVDGGAQRVVRGITWADLHGGAGTDAYPSSDNMAIRLFSDGARDLWYQLYRCIMTFDTSIIPPNAVILSAKLGIYGSGKSSTAAWRVDPAVYQSYPISDTDLVGADYNRIYNTLLSDVITYDDIDPDDWNIWTLNAWGRAAINKGGITRLALKDSHYDAPNSPPSWENYHHCTIWFHTADFGGLGKAPWLEVEYLIPPG